jgi:hypothetical protein
VSSVPLAGGTAKIIGRTREDVRAVRVDANLAQIWTRDASVRAIRSSCVAPLERAQPMLPSGQTDSDASGPFASARWRCPYLHGI